MSTDLVDVIIPGQPDFAQEPKLKNKISTRPMQAKAFNTSKKSMPTYRALLAELDLIFLIKVFIMCFVSVLIS